MPDQSEGRKNKGAAAKGKAEDHSGASWWLAIGIGRWAALSLLLALLALRAADPWPVETLRLKLFDFYQTLNPRPVPVERPVVIVDLDEASLAEVGQWPWPRSVMAIIADRVMSLGGVVIGFDVVFAEKDRIQLSTEADLPFPMDAAMRARLKTFPDNDAVFADVIQGGRVVLGQASWENPAASGREMPPVLTTFAFLGEGSREAAMEYAVPSKDLVRNIDVLEKVAAGRGMFSLLPELDNVVRRVPTLFRYGDTFLPALSIEMLRVAVGAPTLAIETKPGAGITNLIIPGAGRIPTDERGRVWVHYSKSDPGRYLSAKDVLNNTVADDAFRNKLVLFGSSAVGLRDIQATPVESAMPGVEIHAQIIESVMSASYLSRPGYAIGAEATLIALVGLLLIWRMPVVGARWTLLLFLALSGAAVAASWLLFTDYKLMFDSAYGILALFLVYTLLIYGSYAKEEAARERIRRAFGQYLSPDMVERLAREPGRLKLGGEMREMTMLFCDIRGFTTIAEQFDAEGLTQLINRFMTPMSKVILDRNGTIDKYMGDCIMAFWNAPLDDPEHAPHACDAALSIITAVSDLNDSSEKKVREEGGTFVPIRIGVGLNTGTVCVGNMGSDQRFDYTVLGDDVNLASRLEGQSKNYGVDIVIGEATKVNSPHWAALELDLIRVKGKKIPSRIYGLLGDKNLCDDARFQNLTNANGEMLSAYRAQDWNGAMAHFTQCREQARDLNLNLDGFYDLYARRVTEYISAPPGREWDGVFVAPTK